MLKKNDLLVSKAEWEMTKVSGNLKPEQWKSSNPKKKVTKCKKTQLEPQGPAEQRENTEYYCHQNSKWGENECIAEKTLGKQWSKLLKSGKRQIYNWRCGVNFKKNKQRNQFAAISKPNC